MILKSSELIDYCRQQLRAVINSAVFLLIAQACSQPNNLFRHLPQPGEKAGFNSSPKLLLALIYKCTRFQHH